MEPAAEDAGGGERNFPATLPAGAENDAGDFVGRLAGKRTEARRAIVADLMIEKRRVGVAGQNRDHVNTGAVQFQPQRIAEGAQREFAGAVNRVARRGDDADDAADVDDLTRTLPAHGRQHGLDATQRAEEIHLHHLPGVFGFHVHQRRAQADAGIVDENVNAAVLGQHALDKLANIIVPGDIARRDGTARSRHDAGAGGGEGAGGGLADAAGGAGHNGDFVQKEVFHLAICVI